MPAADRDLYRTEPVYSMIRVGFDLTPGTGSILTGPNASQAQADKTLWAFSYGISDTDAVKAGFSANTKPRRDHTCLDRAGIVPQGGEMEIDSITIEPQLLLVPTDLSKGVSSDRLVSDVIGAQRLTADWLGGAAAAAGAAYPASSGVKELRSLLIDLVNRSLVPFWSYGEGDRRNYLPGVAELPSSGKLSDHGGRGVFDGAQLVLPEHIPWTSEGDTREFRVGFEIREEIKNVPFAALVAAPATGLYRQQHAIAEALGVTWQGVTAPPAAESTDDALWFAVLDFKVILHGMRRELQKSGL